VDATVGSPESLLKSAFATPIGHMRPAGG